MQKIFLNCIRTGVFAPLCTLIGATIVACALLSSSAFAQGIVSSTMTGTVVDAAGHPHREGDGDRRAPADQHHLHRRVG